MLGSTPVAAFEGTKGAEITKQGVQAERDGRRNMILANKLQEDLDDATSKAAYGKFTAKMQGVALGYLQKEGANAVAPRPEGWKDNGEAQEQTPYDDAVTALNAYKTDFVDGLTNDRQKYMFESMANATITTTASTLIRHSISEQRKYNKAESGAHVVNLANAAGLNSSDWMEPGGAYDKMQTAALIAVDDHAAVMGWKSTILNEGKPNEETILSSQHQGLRQKTMDTIAGNVLNGLINKDKFFEAAGYMTTQAQKGMISPSLVGTYYKTIETGYNNQNGDKLATSIIEGSSKLNDGSFSSAFNILSSMGVSNAFETGTGPVVSGLSVEANGAGILNQDASEHMQSLNEIWDGTRPSGDDKQNVAWLYIAGQFGVDKANGALTDPKKFWDKAAKIITDHPKLSDARRENLLNGLAYLKDRPNEVVLPSLEDKTKGIPSLAGLIKNARASITNEDQLNRAIDRIKVWHSETTAGAIDQYDNKFEALQDLVYGNTEATGAPDPNAFLNLKPSQLDFLSQKDKALLMEGNNRIDMPDKQIELIENPLLTLPGNIKKYRPYLSESTYQSYLASGIRLKGEMEKGNPWQSASTNVTMFNDELINYKLQPLFQDDPTDAQKEDYIQINAAWMRQIDDWQMNNGNVKADDNRKRILLQELLNNTVNTYKGTNKVNYPISAINRDELDDAYVEVVTATGTVEIAVSRVPLEAREAIIKDMKTYNEQRRKDNLPGKTITETEIVSAWYKVEQKRLAAEIKKKTNKAVEAGTLTVPTAVDPATRPNGGHARRNWDARYNLDGTPKAKGN